MSNSSESDNTRHKLLLLLGGMHPELIPQKFSKAQITEFKKSYSSRSIVFEGEHHLWGYNEFQRYNYLGPGTQYKKRQELGIEPINDLDRIAMYHDAGYSLSQDYPTPAKALTRGYHDLGAGAAMITAGLNPWSDAPFAMSVIAGVGLAGQGFLRIHPMTAPGMALIDHLVY